MFSQFIQRERISNYWNLVEQTADFRYTISWEGARELLAARGFAADQIMRCTVDHGHDVNVGLMLSNNLYVSCDFREDPQSRRLVSIYSWKEWPLDRENDDEGRLASEIFRSADLKDAFDRAVRAFFDFHFRRDDCPLPS